jgi:hypothetical protein
MYDRSGSILTVNGTPSTGGSTNWTGEPSSDALTDPQIQWDPGSQRFYYEVLDYTTDDFAFGFSKNASPQSRNDFCHYDWNFGYGSNLPDYPKLGVTADFVMIGVNDYAGGSLYAGSDLNWIAKPPNGPISTCPDASTLASGGFTTLTNPDGTDVFTPVPAFQTDSSPTGYVVANTGDVGGGASSSGLTVFAVSNDGTGHALLSGGRVVTVPCYTLPANAPQPGKGAPTIDTLDGRLTHAVSAFDPTAGKTAIWTSHAVSHSSCTSASGSDVRWYEIDPTAAAVMQSGTITSTSTYVFNGAVSPDRADNGTTAAFGADAVIGFNTSSSASYPAIQMVSKRGAGAASAWVLVHQVNVDDTDFTCSSPYGPPCRWGDYSGATPDPAADQTQATGRVWLSNQFNGTPSGTMAEWRTWNWEATP